MAQDFPLERRRTMRLTLRIPLKIEIKQIDDTYLTFDAWTTVVNKNGARIESDLASQEKSGLNLHQEVAITVPASGKSATARVAWVSKDENENGNYEFGVELEEAENLWGVQFPPDDWKWQDFSP